MASSRGSATTRPQQGGTVLQLEGVDVPVRARVLGRTQRHVTVEQALPFLRLDSRVLEGDERTARIRRVAVGVEQGVPRLIMELSYDHEEGDATVPYELEHRQVVSRAPEHPSEGSSAVDRMREPTIQFRLPPSDPDGRGTGLLAAFRRGALAMAAWLGS